MYTHPIIVAVLQFALQPLAAYFLTTASGTQSPTECFFGIWIALWILTPITKSK